MTTSLQSPEVSVVIPCFNEQDNVQAIADAVLGVLEPVTESCCIVFIDNGSTDSTVLLLREMCAQDSRIRLIVNSRNFGQMRSPTHAVLSAPGKAVIGMCADFQDPPELLPEFVKRWRDGSKIVLGVRESERSGVILGLARKASYGLQRKFGDYAIIPNATGFGLYDRQVLDEIKALNEPEPFFRGLLVETGFDINTIIYPRPPRARGKSSNNFFTLLDFALNGLAGSSKNLLRAPLYVAFFMALLALGCIFGAIIAAVVGRSVQLWLLVALLEGQFSLIFLFLGLIGVQVKLISERTRNQPLVVERERINFPDGEQ